MLDLTVAPVNYECISLLIPNTVTYLPPSKLITLWHLLITAQNHVNALLSASITSVDCMQLQLHNLPNSQTVAINACKMVLPFNLISSFFF